MEINTYKKILTEIFDVLEFSEQEKSDALSDFEQELAGALYEKTQDALSGEQKQWLKENSSSLKGDEPELQSVREAISARSLFGPLSPSKSGPMASTGKATAERVATVVAVAINRLIFMR